MKKSILFSTHLRKLCVKVLIGGFLWICQAAVLGSTNTTTTLVSSTNSACAGQSVTFTATVAANPGPGTPTGSVSFLDGTNLLANGTLNGAGQATFATNGLAAGAHSLTAHYNGSSNFNASTSLVVTQTIVALPVCLISGPGNLCVSSTNNPYTAPGGLSGYRWSISGSGSLTGATNAQTVTVTAGASGTFILTLNITNSSGCGSTCSQTVSNVAKPTATVSGGGTICSGGSTNIQAALTGMGPWTVVWSDGVTQTNLAASPATRTVSPASNTSYSVTTVTDSNCSNPGTGSASVTVNTPPTLTANPTNRTVCAGASVSFTASASGSPAPGVQWQVSTNGGTNFSNISGATSGTYSFTAALGDNGKQYRAQFSNTCGGVSSTAAALTAVAAPDATITASSSVCANSSNNVASVPDAGVGATYGWTASGATITSGAGTRSITYTVVGAAITLTANVTNGTGCTASSSANASVPAAIRTQEGWRNRAPLIWQSSTFNLGDHQYSDGQSFPFRFTLGNMCPGGSWCIVIKYDFKDANSSRHFYDFLTTYNASEQTVVGQECTNHVCNGAPTTFPIPVDTNLSYQLPGVFTVYNGAVTNVSDYSLVSGSTVDKQLTISGTTAPGTSAQDVLILFGAHLARDNEWGLNSGASQFPGASAKISLQFCGESSFGHIDVNPAGIIQQADMGITKTSSPASLCAGTTLTYSMVVTNYGPDAGNTVTVTDNLPPGLTLVSVTQSQGTFTGTTNLSFSLGTVGATSNTLITVVAVANTNDAAGTIVNTASVSAGSPADPFVANNSASVTNTLFARTTATSMGNQVGCQGYSFSFHTVASGTGPFSYQWTKNGTNIAGASQSSYTIPTVAMSDAGSYCVQVTGFCNSVTNCATLTISTNAAASQILDQVKCPGETATFSTTPSGTGPFTIDWRKDGVIIPGQTNTSLTITNVSTNNAGVYCVEVAGACNATNNCATLTVRTVASASGPINQTNCPGDTVTFSTIAAGTGPFSYQWFGGTNLLAGQTNSSLTLSNVAAGDAGTYSVQVSGPCNTVTNSATLTINTPTTADSPISQTNCLGSLVSFGTAAHGTGPFTYQWFKDNGLLTGQTNNSLTVSNIGAGDAGTYSVQVAGACNSVTNSAMLTIYDATTADALISQTNCPGTDGSFSTIAHGAGPFTFQWTRNGTNIVGATSNVFSIGSISSADAGVYAVQVTGACNSVTNAATLTVNDPTTADAVASQTNCPGTSITFSTTPHGVGPFSYQWYKGVLLLDSQTNNSLTISNLAAGDAGIYSVQVTGLCNSVTNSATLTVLANAFASDLVSLTNCPSTVATFSTLAGGTGPFTYQWTKNGTNIAGATASFYSIPSVSAADAGTYCVQVTGACTSVTNCATLNVLSNATATALVSMTNCPGTTASFSTLADGTGPFGYQWTKNGTNIAGATNNAYSIASVTASDVGTYCVQVTGACTSVTNCATLAVLSNTTATTLTSLTNCPGTTASFSTVAGGTGPFTYQWTKNGTNISGATLSSYSIPSATADDAAVYCVQVSGACTSVTNCATLTVLTNTTATALISLTNCPGTTASFSTVAGGTGPFTYQWTKNGTNIVGASISSFFLPAVEASDAGTYCVQVTGFCTSVTNCATLAVLTNTTASALTALTNCPGTTATFSTVASGTGPITYQWTKNGTNIAGASTSTYSIPSVAAGDAANYCVQVSGFCTTVTNCATLTVLTNTTATGLTSLTNCPGTLGTFSTVAGGTGPFTYQWTKNGTNIAGASDSSYSIPAVSASDAGAYCVQVTGFCTSVTNCATLTVLTNTAATGLTSLTNCPGTTASFSTLASGTGPFTYQWTKNGTNIAAANASSYSIASVAASDAGTYCVQVTGFCTSVTNCAALTVLTNTSATGLTSLTNCPGTIANFNTLASGTGPFSYQWTKNGTNIAGASDSSYSIPAVSASDAGTYCVQVSGLCTSVTNCATLTVLTNTSATGLTSLTNCPGTTANFITVASGTGPFNYQWTKNGTNIVGANVSSYSIASVAASDAGTYCVQVTGFCTSVTNCASLILLTNTSATGLTSLTNCPGTTASFSTVASGTGPFSYQWTKNGTNIAAANASSYSIASVSASDTAIYCVQVTGLCTSATNCASLTVLTNTSATGLTSLTNCPGTTASFSTVASGTGPFTYQWTKNGTNIAAANASSYSIASVAASDAGTYCVQVTGFCTSVTNCASLTVLTNTSATGLTSLTNCPGTTASFSTVASGTGPFTYQWTKNGTNIGGANASSYSIASVGASDAATYCVQVSGFCTSVTNCATLTVLTNTSATGLTSLTNCPGTTASFSTLASGTGPFTYQWTKNGTNIAAANASSYSIASVAASDAGTYCVQLTGFCTSVTNCATLTVLTNTSATGLSSLTNCPGTTASFSTVASGTGPFTYQWTKNGTNIPAANASSYSIASVVASDAATYCVQVSGFCTSVTNCATLTVLTNTSATGLTSLTNCPGTTASFSTVASGTGPFTFQWTKNGTNIAAANASSYSIVSVAASDAGNYCVQVTGFCTSVTNCASLTVLTNTSAAGLTSLTNCPGTIASFSTLASGTGPFTYQWTKNGTNIAAANASSYSIASVAASDAGTYCVQVTGFCTSVTNCATLTVLTNASATGLTSLTNCPGTTASFSTMASGTGPFNYQWTKNGTNIAAANTSSYSIASVAASDAGTYCVQVTGLCTSVTNCATLTVLTNTAATSLTSLTNCPGTTATFSTLASGTGPHTYQWTKNGTNITGASASSYAIPSVAASDAALYCVQVTGFCTSVTNCATLTVLTNTTATGLTSLTNCPGTLATFSTIAGGTGPFTYQWIRNGTNIAGASTSSYSIPSVAAGDAANYCVQVSGFCTSVTNCATLTVLTNTTATGLTSLTNCPGTLGTFSTVAGGTGPFTYQWTKNGTNIAGASASSYSIASVAASDAATYCVQVTGFCTSVTNCATLTVLTNTTATPMISLTNCPGTTASFSTVAGGTGPFTYQWTKNGTNIAGASSSSYSIASVGAGDAATYCVQVSGFCTSVTNCATLTVLTNTTATAVTSLTNCPGTLASFSTVAGGTGPFSYQWTRNGTNIPGQTSSSYSIPAVTAADAGTYCIRVTGVCTSVTNCATLIVLTNATATPVISLTNCPGTLATFSTMAGGTGPFTYQWTKNGTNLAGASASSYSIASVTASDAGTYCVQVSGFCTSVTNCASLTVLTNTSATLVTSLTNCPGTTASFSTVAGGTGPFNYQWTKNGTNIAGATASIYSIAAVAASDAASYCVKVTGFCTSVTNCTSLTVLTNTTATALTSLTNCPGTSANFSTLAEGTGPFTYQWTKNGTNIAGQTTNSYSIASVTATDAGTYCVQVTGGCTSVTNCATLTVLTNTTASALISLTNCPNTTASFSTVAGGTGPFNYQWTKNGTNLAGATTASYTIPSVAPSDAGAYCVIVHGACTSVTNCANLQIIIPGLALTKACPASPVPPGGTLAYSGTVSNSGSVTLTNVMVVNNHPAINTPVFGPTTLAPGQSAGFNGSYIVPPDSCGPYADTLTATANATCTGASVTATKTTLCPGISSPAITVTKICPAMPVAAGQPLVFSGIVSNSGDISLTNTVVVVSQPTNNTPVFGPVILAPGEFARFSGSYIVPQDTCANFISDLVTATARSSCTGSNVSGSMFSFCPVVTAPRLALGISCTGGPIAPGGLLSYSGSVSNSGGVTLTNVMVVSDHPSNNTPLLGPVTLAPGATTNFAASYNVCPECCGPYVDTLTANANDRCTGSNVVAQAAASCPGITHPSIAVSKLCPSQSVLQGQPLTFAGSVSNSGDVVLSDIEVNDDRAGFVAHFSALAPGETQFFLASYTPTNCGPSVASTLTATAADGCTGGSVTNRLTAGCPVTCAPVSVTIVNPALQDGFFLFSFLMQTGRLYTVQWTPLLPPTWAPLTNFIGNGSMVTIQDPRTQAQRFYRVLVQ